MNKSRDNREHEMSEYVLVFTIRNPLDIGNLEKNIRKVTLKNSSL